MSVFHLLPSAQRNPPGATKTHNPSQRLEAASGAPGETGGQWGLPAAPGAASRGVTKQHLQSLPITGTSANTELTASPGAPDPSEIIAALGIFWY